MWVGRYAWAVYWSRLWKLISHFGPEGARLSCLTAIKVSSLVLSKVANSHICTHTLSRCADCQCQCHHPPCTAVGHITQVSRAKTSLTHRLIVWTSPEINFDVECLWASSSGPTRGKEVAGQLRLWAKCVCHMQRYEREHERGGVWERERERERARERERERAPPPYTQWGVTRLLQICLIHIQLTWCCGLIGLALIHLSSLCDRSGACLN